MTDANPGMDLSPAGLTPERIEHNRRTSVDIVAKYYGDPEFKAVTGECASARTPEPAKQRTGRLAPSVAVMLLAAWLSPQALGQSLGAARIDAPARTAAKIGAETTRPAVAPSLVIDLGPFDEGPQALAAASDVGGPPLVGLHRPVPRAFSGDLVPRITWVPDGADRSARGAFQVCSRGAASIRVRVAAALPDGAQVTVFDGNGGSPRESWSGADIAEGGADGAWLPSQEGECLTVEATFADTGEAQSARLWLRNVAHRFPGDAIEAAHTEAQRAQGARGEPIGETAVKHDTDDSPMATCRNVRSTTCRSASGSTSRASRTTRAPSPTTTTSTRQQRGPTNACTGTLINDGRGDDGGPLEPLFLTAAHCVNTPAEAKTMELAFDWIDSECGPEEPERLARPSTLLATAPEFDQTLVQLPRWPGPSGSGRVALGWNAEEVLPQTRTRTLSHPNGARMAYTLAEVLGTEDEPT